MAAKQQYEFVGLLARDMRFRGPMFALWMSDFGSSLHMPVITFFFLELGASAMDIGYFGFCRALGALLLSPVYGRCVDRRGIKLPLLICIGMCGVGCLVRGTATSLSQLYVASIIVGMGGGSSWSLVKGHIARHTSEEDRGLVVVGLRLQMVVLSFSKVLYPALDFILRATFHFEGDLPRYRAVVMTCMVFCWVGIAAVALCPPQLVSDSARGERVAAVAPSSPSPLQLAALSKASGSSPASVPLRLGSRLVFLAAALGVVTCCSTACSTLWPLFLKMRFEWGAREFAYASSIETVALAAALAGYPRMIVVLGGGRIGCLRAARALSCGAALAVFVAFCIGPALVPRGPVWVVSIHVMPALLASATLGTLGPCLETVASLFVPVHFQGLTMGMLNAAAAVGGLAGHLAGPALWTSSLQLDAASTLGEGRLPYLSASCLLLALALTLSLPCLASTDGGGEACATVVTAEKLGVPDEDEEGRNGKVIADISLQEDESLLVCPRSLGEVPTLDKA